MAESVPWASRGPVTHLGQRLPVDAPDADPGSRVSPEFRVPDPSSRPAPRRTPPVPTPARPAHLARRRSRHWLVGGLIALTLALLIGLAVWWWQSQSAPTSAPPPTPPTPVDVATYVSAHSPRTGVVALAAAAPEASEPFQLQLQHGGEVVRRKSLSSHQGLIHWRWRGLSSQRYTWQVRQAGEVVARGVVVVR